MGSQYASPASLTGFILQRAFAFWASCGFRTPQPYSFLCTKNACIPVVINQRVTPSLFFNVVDIDICLQCTHFLSSQHQLIRIFPDRYLRASYAQYTRTDHCLVLVAEILPKPAGCWQCYCQRKRFPKVSLYISSGESAVRRMTASMVCGATFSLMWALRPHPTHLTSPHSHPGGHFFLRFSHAAIELFLSERRWTRYCFV